MTEEEEDEEEEEAMPSICENISVFNLRLASCSPSAPRADTIASISSKNTIEGLQTLAASNRQRTIFSLSPRNLEMSEDEEQLKNVELLKPHTAFASIVLPVPGLNEEEGER